MLTHDQLTEALKAAAARKAELRARLAALDQERLQVAHALVAADGAYRQVADLLQASALAEPAAAGAAQDKEAKPAAHCPD